MSIIAVLWHLINVILYMHKALLNRQLEFGEGNGLLNSTEKNRTFAGQIRPPIFDSPVLFPSSFFNRNFTTKKLFRTTMAPDTKINFRHSLSTESSTVSIAPKTSTKTLTNFPTTNSVLSISTKNASLASTRSIQSSEKVKLSTPAVDEVSPTTTAVRTTSYAPEPFTNCTEASDCPKGHKCMISTCVLDIKCPRHQKFGPGPPKTCEPPSDPNNLPPSALETWFTKNVFDDLFPKANIGWGPKSCWPYSYESLAIAARYFPEFGSESPANGLSEIENVRRDLSAFFAHAVQETGENDASIYEKLSESKQEADACFYRGGFFNWFEGGPISSFLPKENPGFSPSDGEICKFSGKYCAESVMLNYWFPCNKEKASKTRKIKDKHRNSQFYSGCYFGRGAIQISYNYNYGQFQEWLAGKNISVDLLKKPNLVMTKMDPPLAVLASLWFYMTPQPPKPAMHDIILGNWEPGPENRAAGYEGPIFGPTSLVINNECNGEDPEDPGGPGESRRIKAFKWFTRYFGVPSGREQTLSCKNMPVQLASIQHKLSYQPNWGTTWKEKPCDCAPATYGGMIPYFEEGFYPQRFVDLNELNRVRCVRSVYGNPGMYAMSNDTSACLNHESPFVE